MGILKYISQLLFHLFQLILHLHHQPLDARVDQLLRHAVAIGAGAGTLPARKASLIPPIQALLSR